MLQFMLGSHKHLSHVIRYSTVPKISKESVAEHSFFVAFYVDLLCDYAEANGVKVDRAKAVSRALMHDAEESISSDLPYNVKHGSKGLLEQIQIINKACMKEMLSCLPKEIAERRYEIWVSAKSKDIEGQLVEAADSLSLMVYCIQEKIMGNNAIIPVMKGGFEVLVKRAEALEWLNPLVEQIKIFMDEIIKKDDWYPDSAYAKMIKVGEEDEPR